MSVISGIYGAEASKDAASTQAKSAEKAVEAQLQMYNQSRADQYPWRTAGTNALNKMSGLMGMGYIPSDTGAASYGQPNNALAGYYQPGSMTSSGGYQVNAPGGGMTGEQVYQQLMAEAEQTGDTSKVMKFIADYQASGEYNPMAAIGEKYPMQRGEWSVANYTGQQQAAPLPGGTQANALYPGGTTPDQARAAEMKSFYTSPGYEFRLGEGLNAIRKGASARGGLDSGATMRAMQRYGEGLAATEYGDYWNRLAAMSGVGQTSVQSTGQLGANTANQMGQAYINAGNARASGYIGQANALSGAMSSGANALAYYNAMNRYSNQQPNYAAMNAVPAYGASGGTIDWASMGGGP